MINLLEYIKQNYDTHFSQLKIGKMDKTHFHDDVSDRDSEKVDAVVGSLHVKELG